jgi:outer membrane protein TolC
MRVALENIEKARAQYGITRADLLPGITAQAQSNRTRGGRPDDGSASTTTSNTRPSWVCQLRAGPVGPHPQLSEASLQQFLQSQDNQRNVQIGLVADVANAWLTLAADQARLQLARTRWTAASRL